MKSTLKSFLSIQLLAISSATMAAPSPKIDAVYNFLLSTVEAKKFRTESHGELASGVRYDFYRTTVISNLRRSESILAFQLIGNIKQDLFDRLADGSFSTSSNNKDRVVVSQCEVTEMKSTHSVQGFCSIAANSSSGDMAHGINTVKISLADEILTMASISATYADSFGPGNTFVPGRSEAINTFFKNESGKTVFTEAYSAWMVNPETLERTSEIKVTPLQTIIGE